MEEAKGFFAGEDHASLYKAFRPEMNFSTVQRIIDFLAKTFNPSECDAVDVGCGSGQGTVPLSPFLHHIVGLDPSQAQINAIKSKGSIPDNVEFRVGIAEKLPFNNSSLHLVTVKTALHWFDLPKFFQEVDRVLKPGGVLAVSTETYFNRIAGFEKESDDIFFELAKEYRTRDHETRWNLFASKYASVKFPYEECVRYESFVDENVTIKHIIEFGKTRSDVAKFMKSQPEKAAKVLKDTEERLMKLVGATGRPEDTNVVQRTPEALIMCRKPQLIVK